mgnify:CR=1 FL=1
MEKVIRACIALLLGIFLFACGGKQQESDTATDNSVQVDSTTAADTILQQAYAPVSEIFEYRSESLSNYELYGVYPYQDAPVFVVVRNGKARLLKLDEEREVEEGQGVRRLHRRRAEEAQALSLSPTGWAPPATAAGGTSPKASPSSRRVPDRPECS